MSAKLIGVGLRSPHYPHLQSRPKTQVDWFEVITENVMDSFGRPLKMLEFIREDYPVGLHGVSLNIASYQDLNWDYLKKLKNLIGHICPMVVSDHLCWTGLKKNNLHNLLPFPYDQEHLDHIVARVNQIQEFLGRSILLENLSAYLSFNHSTFTEAQFLRELASKTGCKILLDLNNVYVNSVNQQFDAPKFIDDISFESVGQIHLAGFSDRGDFLFDTHSRPIQEPVWEIFENFVRTHQEKIIENPIPILIEWDEDIPEFNRLEEEAIKVRNVMTKLNSFNYQDNFTDIVSKSSPLNLELQTVTTPGGTLSISGAFKVYENDYSARMSEVLGEVYPSLWKIFGDEDFFKLCRVYIKNHPSTSYNLNDYGDKMAEFLLEVGERDLQFKSFFSEIFTAKNLSELANLEWEIHNLFHAPLNQPVSAHGSVQWLEGQLDSERESESEFKNELKLQGYKLFYWEKSQLSLWKYCQQENTSDTTTPNFDWYLKPQWALIYKRDDHFLRTRELLSFEAKIFEGLELNKNLGNIIEELEGAFDPTLSETTMSNFFQFLTQNGPQFHSHP
jgi:uncharacterized protein (UPF0276 family)